MEGDEPKSCERSSCWSNHWRCLGELTTRTLRSELELAAECLWFFIPRQRGQKVGRESTKIEIGPIMPLLLHSKEKTLQPKGGGQLDE